MARTISEWIGKTDDSKAPPRVCQRVFDRADGICHFCGQYRRVPKSVAGRLLEGVEHNAFPKVAA